MNALIGMFSRVLKKQTCVYQLKAAISAATAAAIHHHVQPSCQLPLLALFIT